MSRCTSTGSEAFSLFICLDANTFVLLSFFCLPKSFNQTTAQWCKIPIPVDVRRSKTLLLKLPSVGSLTSHKNHNSETAERRSLRFFRSFLRRLKCLTFCRCEYKGSTFSSVSLNPECWSGAGLMPRPPARQTGAYPIELLVATVSCLTMLVLLFSCRGPVLRMPTQSSKVRHYFIRVLFFVITYF